MRGEMARRVMIARLRLDKALVPFVPQTTPPHPLLTTFLVCYRLTVGVHAALYADTVGYYVRGPAFVADVNDDGRLLLMTTWSNCLHEIEPSEYSNVINLLDFEREKSWDTLRELEGYSMSLTHSKRHVFKDLRIS